MTEQHKSLAEALVAFQGSMPVVLKARTANVGAYSYTYAALADVTAAAVPILAQHGLAFSAQPHRTEQGPYELVGVLLHTSGERETGSLPISGGTPQALGSAITYARRYLLGCMTGMVTDDDDDGAAASKQPAAKTARAAATRTMSRAPKTDPETITEDQMKALHASFNDAGITDREQRLAYCTNLLQHPIESSKELTKAEASRVIDALKADMEDPWAGDQP